MRAFVHVSVLALMLLAAGFAAPGTAAQTPQPAGVTEYQVKAAFLFNFAKFIDWPPQKFPRPDSPLIIGLMGEDPFEGSLDALIQNQTIHKRPLELRRLKAGEDAKPCHILFVSRSEKSRLAEILSSVRGASVVTVSDTDQFLEQGGMINFFMESESVKFAINVEAAEQAGLALSSKLLAVARIVKIKPSG